MAGEAEKKPVAGEAAKTEVCGLVMPISLIDGLPEAHWLEVRAILSEAIEKAGFEPSLVSDADDIGIIQKRIIQNLYDNPIVVVDVSAKNPNVMFELGMRLAFDKPTIIVKDDKTSYSFDTAPIEHLSYPRDLRYAQINQFKERLSEKIIGTHRAATNDKHYTTFLKHFGEFTVAKLDKKEVSGQEFILEEIRAIRASITRLERPKAPTPEHPLPDLVVTLSKAVKRPVVQSYLKSVRTIKDWSLLDRGGFWTVMVILDEDATAEDLQTVSKKIESLDSSRAFTLPLSGR